MLTLFAFLSLVQGVAEDPGSATPTIAVKVLPDETCGNGDEEQDIVVCGKRQSDRYRVSDPDAPFDPGGNSESVSRERSRWIEEGDTGIMSCSAVGPGGWTGCGHKAFKRKRQQKGWYL